LPHHACGTAKSRLSTRRLRRLREKKKGKEACCFPELGLSSYLCRLCTTCVNLSMLGGGIHTTTPPHYNSGTLKLPLGIVPSLNLGLMGLVVAFLASAAAGLNSCVSIEMPRTDRTVSHAESLETNSLDFDNRPYKPTRQASKFEAKSFALVVDGPHDSCLRFDCCIR
jgi:hypothetical protein